MEAASAPPELRVLASALALRIGPIFAALRDLVAARFLRDPRLVLLIVPLWNRLGRAARRFDRLMARLAAGHLPAQRAPRADGSSRGGGAPKPDLPTAEGWLLRALRHEAAVYTNRLRRLLAEPGMAEFLAANPGACRILRPLCHMLGVRHASLGVTSRALPPKPARARPSSRKPRGARRHAGRAVDEAPEASIPATTSLHPIVLAANPRPRTEWQPPPRQVAPLCPRLEQRWPWNTLPATKPA